MAKKQCVNTSIAILDFITRGKNGSVTTARGLVRLRRQIGEYVNAVSIV